MLNSVSDLQGYIDKSQLTEDLGGTLEYRHRQWISHRTVSTSLCAVFSVSPCFLEDRVDEDQLLGGHCLWLPTTGEVGFSKPQAGRKVGRRVKAGVSPVDALHLTSLSGMGVWGLDLECTWGIFKEPKPSYSSEKLIYLSWDGSPSFMAHRTPQVSLMYRQTGSCESTWLI